MLHAALWVAAVVALAVALGQVTRQAAIPPSIEADYAYTFTAADRLYAGLGATCTPPRAPRVPWEWRCDWGFLTQWPVGYPLLLCGVRALLGFGSATAGVALGILCSALAVVAWFSWARACVPRGWLSIVLAGVVGLSALSASGVVHPSTDTVFVALMPLVLLLTRRALVARRAGQFVLAGIAAGACCWIRYAAIALPAGIGAFLVLEWLLRRRSWRDWAAFGLAAATPIIALLLLNRTLGGSSSVQQQLNLGTQIAFQLDTVSIVAAWRHFTEQSLYAHRPEAAWCFVLFLPAAGLAAIVFRIAARKPQVDVETSKAMQLSAAVALATLAFLVAAGTLFRGKYDFAAKPRYYLPIRPLYFVIFVGPLLAMRWRALRTAMLIPLLAAGTWFVREDFGRTMQRWSAAAPAATEYGRASRRFGQHATELFTWLKSQRGDDLVVFSNFHEEIELETWIPAAPTPDDRAQLDDWLARIAATRGVAPARVLFVLDPDNDYRSYYLPPPAELVRRFDLTPDENSPAEVRAMVYRLGGATALAHAGK